MKTPSSFLNTHSWLVYNWKHYPHHQYYDSRQFFYFKRSLHSWAYTFRKCGRRNNFAATIKHPSLVNQESTDSAILHTSAISSAEGSLLSKNHPKKLRLFPSLRLRFCPFVAVSWVFVVRSMPLFQKIGVDFDSGSPSTKKWQWVTRSSKW